MPEQIVKGPIWITDLSGFVFIQDGPGEALDCYYTVDGGTQDDSWHKLDYFLTQADGPSPELFCITYQGWAKDCKIPHGKREIVIGWVLPNDAALYYRKFRPFASKVSDIGVCDKPIISRQEWNGETKRIEMSCFVNHKGDVFMTVLYESGENLPVWNIENESNN